MPGHKFDSLRTIDRECLEESLEPFVSILLVHFDDPGSGFNGIVERHISGNKLKVGELLVEGLAHVGVEFLSRGSVRVNAKDPAR